MQTTTKVPMHSTTATTSTTSLRDGVSADGRHNRKPVIIHEGKNKDKTVEVAQARAKRDGVTVYIQTSKVIGNRTANVIILEITPWGDIREIPPVGLAVGIMDQMQDKVMAIMAVHEGEEAKQFTKQELKKLAGAAQFAKLVDEAAERLKAK